MSAISKTYDPRLEPRIASLETELRGVIKLVGELSRSVSEATERVETQIHGLAVALERVGAPKQANWLALVGASVSVVLLCVTIGSLVLMPISKEINRFESWQEHHDNLELHPVGKTRIDALEKSVLERAAINAAGIRDLDVKLQKEYQLMDASVRERVGASEREVRERWVFDAAGLKKIEDNTAENCNRITVLETLLRK